MVYEGVDLTTNSMVALKVMSVKDGKATVPIKGVRREIEYASSVQHENVVKLVDFVVDERQIVIVWELISGSDLLDLLNERGGRLEEPQAASYFAQLLRGVNFIHSHGLCHRDLKPENCMIESSTDKLKIIDFGLSKHQQSAVTLGVGTPDYMAPELLGGAGSGFAALQERRIGQYDARACDVWAMGVLLYLLVTGQYPFEDPRQPQNVVATLQNIAAGRMRPLPHRISPECADLITAMLTQDPQTRITLLDIGQHPWLRLFGRELRASSAIKDFENIKRPARKVEDFRPAVGIARGTESFTFPEQPSVVTKGTPATPKVIALNAQTGAALIAAAISPTVSPPGAEDRPNRDLVVPLVSGSTASQSPAGDPGKRPRLGGFCRMWFGGVPRDAVC